MARMVKRLSQLEIDEVSLVDRPANQHGLVAIAKNDQEDADMELYDIEGNPVTEDELEPGMRVYGADGTEYVYTENEPDDVEDALEDVDQGELAGVGKGIGIGPARAGVAGLGDRAKLGVSGAEGFARRNKKAIGVAGAAGAGGFAGGRVGKSFGDEVLQELSKALNEPERDAVIAKALSRVEEVAKRNDELEGAVAFLMQDREREDFVELAKSYDGLATDEDELAGILQTVAPHLSGDQLQALDRILTGASEVGKALYVERGYNGTGDVGVLGQVLGMADEAVIKNAELGVSPEQAVAAIFDSNPEAYDTYLSEQN